MHCCEICSLCKILTAGEEHLGIRLMLTIDLFMRGTQHELLKAFNAISSLSVIIKSAGKQER